MKQVLYSLNDGSTSVENVPQPGFGPGQILVQTELTLVSAGTERMLAEFGKAGWISRAHQQPDKVRQVLEKAKTDGIGSAIDAVRSKMDKPLALGYCNVGTVVAHGTGVEDFSQGDRVVSNGTHGEFVSVPKNLCVKIPDNVSSEAASFTVLGAIGLQGIRLAKPTLGEAFVVTGLGLIGMMVLQMLTAQGCRVLGVDLDESKLALARQFGAETANPADGEALLAFADSFSYGHGVDGVIITASTKSNDPMRLAARMCRKRGRIVLVGVVGLQLNRDDYYEKELSFQVSCSYGPGRYDPHYEEDGHDYPIGYVRWTEKRNFIAVLELLSSGRLNVEPLVSHRFDVDDAPKAMDLLTSKKPSSGIILRFPNSQNAVLEKSQNVIPLRQTSSLAGKCTVAFIGSGNYASRTLIPAFKKNGAKLATLVSASGISAAHFGKKFDFAEAASDLGHVLENDAIDTIVIATRHNLHAHQVLSALQAGKHVFCEKPLCLTSDELNNIEAAKSSRPEQLLMAGFNRRFAPHIVQIKDRLSNLPHPKNFILTVNAGAIPSSHWTQDPQVGGGRIIGEACHFIDLLRYLAGAPIESFQTTLSAGTGQAGLLADSAIITLRFSDGSAGVINYLSNGHNGVPKERLEIFASGRVLKLDNFKKLRAFGFPGFRPIRLWQSDKGQVACSAAFVNAVKSGGHSPIPIEEVFEITRVSIQVAESLK